MPDFFKRLRARPAALLLAAALLSAAALSAAEGLYRLSLRFEAAAKGKRGAFQLYGVGDSSMMGLPFFIAAPDIVSRLFAGRLDGRPLLVNNLAEGGSSIYPQALRAARALNYRDRSGPAVVLIYAGHAENITARKSRFSAPAWVYEQFKRHVLFHSLLFSKLVFDLERRFLVYGLRDLDHYEFYLRKVVETSLEAGALPVLATLGSNSQVEPSMNEYGLPIAGEVEKAYGLEERGEYARAIARYAGLAAALPPGEKTAVGTYLSYRAARCRQLAGQAEAARAGFREVLENDPYPLRAKPSQNAIIRRLAKEYSIPLVDAETLFSENSPGGVTGGELFVDAMHPSPAGTLLLARAFAARLGEIYHDGIRDDIRDPRTIYEPRRIGADSRELPYAMAGACLLWAGQGSLPVPDSLRLAEKNFRKSLALAPGNRPALLGLRVAEIARKNRFVIPQAVYDWYQRKRAYYEFRRPVPDAEMAEADGFLSKWEGASGPR